jgi:hypothetical protein
MAIKIPEPDLSTGDSALEAQALRLWRFVQRHVPRFSREQAVEVLHELKPSEHDEIRPFATRLRQSLKARRAMLTHSATLQAAARVLRDEDWYHARLGQLLHTLMLLSFNDGPDQPLTDWHQAASRLASICEDWNAGHPEARAFEIKATPITLVVSALEIDSSGAPVDWPTMPIAVINAAEPNEQWLTGVGSAVEMLRRRLEEPRIGVLDGLEVLSFCDQQERPWMGDWKPEAKDAPNTELVLVREDNPLMPGSGYEITRGDEIVCFTQLDLAMKGKTGEISVDDTGGWVWGDARYLWHVVTLRARGFSPGLSTAQLGPNDARTLLRRYRVAKQILGRQLPYRAGRKRLEYLGGPDETYRLDLKRLQWALQQAGTNWEDYCAQIGEPGKVMVAELPMEFVLPLLSKLMLEDPGRLLARPSREELSRADDDSMLRALLPRVDHIRYRVTESVGQDKQAMIKGAIEELSGSLFIRIGGMSIEDPLPDLVYGSDGEELRALLDELGLVAYVGVMPHFRKIPKNMEGASPEMYPYALGHSLYLEIVVKDS